MFLAKCFVLFGKNNKFKKYHFEDTKKAQRAFERLKRKGLDVQYLY